MFSALELLCGTRNGIHRWSPSRKPSVIWNSLLWLETWRHNLKMISPFERSCLVISLSMLRSPPSQPEPSNDVIRRRKIRHTPSQAAKAVIRRRRRWRCMTALVVGEDHPNNQSHQTPSNAVANAVIRCPRRQILSTPSYAANTIKCRHTPPTSSNAVTNAVICCRIVVNEGSLWKSSFTTNGHDLLSNEVYYSILRQNIHSLNSTEVKHFFHIVESSTDVK